MSFTHEVTDGIHGAIVKARMPADPAAKAFPSSSPRRAQDAADRVARPRARPLRSCALPAQELVRDGAQRGSEERREQVDPERVQLASC